MVASTRLDTSATERTPFRRMAVPVVLSSAVVGHLVNAATGELWGVVASMAAVAVVGMAIVSIKYYRETGRDWRAN